jgi:dihydroxy-acid dehydratase
MSGTSFGTGDLISLDLANRRLDVAIEPEEWERRREFWHRPVSRHLRGWPLLYQSHVTQADTGCDVDFLTADTPQKRTVIAPTIGRS